MPAITLLASSTGGNILEKLLCWVPIVCLLQTCCIPKSLIVIELLLK